MVSHIVGFSGELISESTRNVVQKFARASRTNMDLALDILNRDLALATKKKYLRTLLTNLGQKYDGVLIDVMNEDSFVKSRVDPVMGAFFKTEDDIIIDGSSTALASSAAARKKFDPYLRGKMADITVSIMEENVDNLIIMEVKPPAKAKSDVDLLKMADMMKDSIDFMHSKGLDSIGLYVMGVIIEGYRCDLYVMDLDNTFLYRLLKIGTFYIPVDLPYPICLDTALKLTDTTLATCVICWNIC
ncbi:unnamed protein product [Absidia cylindrospora]